MLVAFAAVSILGARSSGAESAGESVAIKIRKGQVVVVSAGGGRILDRTKGKQKADEFGAAYSFGDVPGAPAGVLIGAPGADRGSGRVWALNRLTGRVVFSLLGSELAGGPVARFGFRIRELGHIFGESTHWMASAPGTGDPDGPPAAVVLFHVREAELRERLRLEGPAGSRFGFSLLAVDNLFEDAQLDQVIAGAPTLARNGKKRVGAVHAFASDTGELQWVARGKKRNQYFGFSASVFGDADEDGSLDILVGAPGRRNGRTRGFVAVLSGATGLPLHTIGAPQGAELFGLEVRASDVDGDGTQDIVVGAPATDGRAGVDTGAVFAFSGLNRDLIWRREGEVEHQWFGFSIHSLQDLDDDGVNELAVASRHLNPTNSKRDRRGGVDVISPVETEVLSSILGKRAGDHLGWRILGPGEPEGLAIGALRGPAPYLPE